MKRTEFIFGLGFGVVCLFAPWVWPSMPHSIAIIGFTIGIILMIHGAWDWIRGRYKGSYSFTVEGPVSVDFSKLQPGKKIRITLHRVRPTEENATLYLQLSRNSITFNKEKGRNYQVTGSGFPTTNFDHGVALLVPVSNKFGDEINGWIEIDNDDGEKPRREFRFHLTGVDRHGQYESSNGHGVYIGSHYPITYLRLSFLPGLIAAGRFEMEQKECLSANT